MRHRFIVGGTSAEWEEAAFVGNWFVASRRRKPTSWDASCSAIVDEPAGGPLPPMRNRRWCRSASSRAFEP